MRTNYVGLDPSYTAFGLVCVDDNGTLIARDILKTEEKKFPCRQARLDHIVTCVLRFLDDTQPDLVGIEGYAFGAMTNREMLGGLGEMVRWAMWKNGYAFVEVSVPTLKKYVLGKGNGPKSEMLRGVERKWKYDAKDDNDADAYALARLAEELRETGGGMRTKAFRENAKKLKIVEPARFSGS